MKAWSALSARRLAVTGVAAATAVSLLGGCGFEIRQQAAAVVDGHVINEDEVRETTAQLRGAKLEFTEGIVVTALIAAPLLDQALQGSNSWQPDDTYAQTVASISDPTETTKEFIEAVAIIQSQKMTEADTAKYRQALETAKISVNPKFGELVKTGEGPVYFALGADTPNWIAPESAPAVPTAPAQ